MHNDDILAKTANYYLQNKQNIINSAKQYYLKNKDTIDLKRKHKYATDLEYQITLKKRKHHIIKKLSYIKTHYLNYYIFYVIFLIMRQCN